MFTHKQVSLTRIPIRVKCYVNGALVLISLHVTVRNVFSVLVVCSYQAMCIVVH